MIMLQMLIFKNSRFHFPSNSILMAFSSFSSVPSSSFFHHNDQFSTRKKVHQVRYSYHGLKSSKCYGKLKKTLHYSLNLILIFSTLSNIDSYPKSQNLIHKFTPFKSILLNTKSLLKNT